MASSIKPRSSVSATSRPHCEESIWTSTASFGISFAKSFLVSKGASPVFYVACSSMVSDLTGSTITRAKYFDEKVALYQRLNGHVERALLSKDGRVKTM